MKVTNKNNPTTTFEELKMGECFKWNGYVYIKARTIEAEERDIMVRLMDGCAFSVDCEELDRPSGSGVYMGITFIISVIEAIAERLDK